MLLALFEIWLDRSLLEQHLVVYNIYPLEKKKSITFVQCKTSLEPCPSSSYFTLALITAALLPGVPPRALRSSARSPLNLFSLRGIQT